jgi:uncharacterized protein
MRWTPATSGGVPLQLYVGPSKQFIDDAFFGEISRKLEEAYVLHYRRRPGQPEIRSWQNSLRSMAMVLERAGLKDQGVVLEHQLPLTSKRLDCMVLGRDAGRRDQAVVVELKQWERTEPSEADQCVVTFVGQGNRDVLHPSVQVGQYAQYLSDYHTAFSEEDVGLAACAYLHNLRYDPADELFAIKHQDALDAFPLFTADRGDELTHFLSERVEGGEGDEVLNRILGAPVRPSRKLLEHTAEMIAGQHVFTLLDEQLVVFQTVLAAARKAVHRAGKTVILVRGGPGTGKSVVALHLVGRLAQKGYDAQHATGSRSFTGNVRKLVGRRASHQFKYFNNYALAEPDSVQVLVMDEAHRIRASSASRFTPKAKQSGEPQIDELMKAAKVPVFFLDDLQVVRPNEVGSAALIREAASRWNAELKEFELEAQFRCAGSDGFVNWVDNTLGIRATANELWDPEDEAFDFGLVDDVRQLEAWVRGKNAEGYTARLVAGFCWPWSDPRPDGTLEDDVVVGSWRMPWNAKPDAGRLARDIPRADYWATDPHGVEQVGCVYTAQGFEFDYVGVIFGTDLRYEPRLQSWVGEKRASYDVVVKRSGDRFVELVKHTYRVLLTRGLKGCRVVLLDGATHAHLVASMGGLGGP